ncbi:hypothetical protein ACLGEA_07395 [Helicobacter pylori]|uniref:hypothetical protein n=1 Tax=Helicobacter pylori TaxID=210 RepID=UPI0035AB6D2F
MKNFVIFLILTLFVSFGGGEIHFLKFEIHFLKFEIHFLKFEIHFLKFEIHFLKFEIHFLKFEIHFLKGIGGYFEITLPLNPLNIPLTPQDRFFSKVIACLTQALLLFILKMLKHFLNSINSIKQS